MLWKESGTLSLHLKHNTIRSRLDPKWKFLLRRFRVTGCRRVSYHRIKRHQEVAVHRDESIGPGR